MTVTSNTCVDKSIQSRFFMKYWIILLSFEITHLEKNL